MLEVLRQFTAVELHGLHVELAGAVGGAHEWAGHDGGEAHVVSSIAVLNELFRLHPALNRVELRAGAQVLGDGDDVGASILHVLQRLQDLLTGFTHAEDEVGFGDQPVVTRCTNNLQ